jgi:integrase
LSLRGTLPDFLKPVITIAYDTGLRRGEIIDLTWDRVDLSSRRIFLAPGTTKTDESRIIDMTDDLHKILSAWKRFHDWIVPNYPRACFRLTGTKALAIREFRGAWKDACKIVGLEKRRLHDFRRTAVRNMVRAGVPELVAMRISGHQTRNVFDRYNITSESDLDDAASKLGTYLEVILLF